jgi:putative ABC transport system permease protein
MLSRILQTFLFDVKPTDHITFIGVGLIFAIVALLARMGVPTHRAVRVDFLEALRFE